MLTSPHDLLAAIPFLIGYHPLDSLVLVSLKDDQIGMAMRVDFPKDIAVESYDLLASHLVREGAEGAFLVAYTSEVIDAEPVLISAAAALLRAGIVLKESLIVSGNRYRSLLCATRTDIYLHDGRLLESRFLANRANEISQVSLPFWATRVPRRKPIQRQIASQCW